MEKRKRKNQGFLGDIKKLIQERDRFYKGLEEIKALEQSIDRLREENEEQVKAFDMEFDSSKLTGSYSRLISDKYPGREVFFPENRCQCFNTDRIEKMKLKDGVDYERLRTYLKRKENVEELIVNESLFQLYILMTVDSDEFVVKSCYEVLASNIRCYVPSMGHIVKTFLNWGATCESLNILELERKHLFHRGIREKTKDASKNFHRLNYSSVLDYVGEICKRNPEGYKKTDKAILLKCLLRISLDELFSDVMASLRACINKVVDSFLLWDSFTVTTVCRLIHDEEEHFHNQLAIATIALPKVDRCKDLSSCICYNIFCSLVQSKSKYEFPYEDEKIVELVKMIEVDPENADDLYKLYVLMQLLNFLIYQRNLPSKPTILMEIVDELKKLERTISKSTKIFDAAFVKGRISYCCAMWSISKTAETSSCC